MNGRRLLEQMLLSVDVEVEQPIVVDNGGIVGGFSVPDIGRAPARVISPGHNLGVAASWNLIMKSVPKAPYWLFVNHDVAFGPGALKAFEEAIEPDRAEIVHLLGFAAFAITAPALDAVGYFDENFHPAYDEDCDFSYRAHLAGVARKGLDVSIEHVGSATIYANDGALREANHRTHGLNNAYYDRKWGGPPGVETYRSPFGRGGPVWAWSLEPGRLRDLDWGL